MRWLEDLFFLAAFVVAVALVTFSVYDGNAYPKAHPAGIVVTRDNPEREIPRAQRPVSRTIAVITSADAAPVE